MSVQPSQNSTTEKHLRKIEKSEISLNIKGAFSIDGTIRDKNEGMIRRKSPNMVELVTPLCPLNPVVKSFRGFDGISSSKRNSWAKLEADSTRKNNAISLHAKFVAVTMLIGLLSPVV